MLYVFYQSYEYALDLCLIHKHLSYMFSIRVTFNDLYPIDGGFLYMFFYQSYGF